LPGLNFSTVNWYIVSNSSSGKVDATYSPIVLLYNKPVTVAFASYAPGTFTPFTVNGGGAQILGQNPPVLSLVFITVHGCLGLRTSSCSNANTNYGQSIPYVSTLYT
jgi:hypothetical protein